MHGTGVCVVISRLVWGLTATREPPSARLSERVREWRDVSLLTCLQWPWCWPWSYPCPRWLATTALKLAIYLIDSLSLSTQRNGFESNSVQTPWASTPLLTAHSAGQARPPSCLPASPASVPSCTVPTAGAEGVGFPLGSKTKGTLNSPSSNAS